MQRTSLVRERQTHVCMVHLVERRREVMAEGRLEPHEDPVAAHFSSLLVAFSTKQNGVKHSTVSTCIEASRVGLHGPHNWLHFFLRLHDAATAEQRLMVSNTAFSTATHAPHLRINARKLEIRSKHPRTHQSPLDMTAAAAICPSSLRCCILSEKIHSGYHRTTEQLSPGRTRSLLSIPTVDQVLRRRNGPLARRLHPSHAALTIMMLTSSSVSNGARVSRNYGCV